MKKCLFRLYQKIMYVLSFFISFKEPKIFESIESITEIIIQNKKDNVLIVTDDFLVKTDVFNRLTKLLEKEKISYTVYSGTKPNPSIDLIEEAYQLYKTNQCDSLIAYGGGSAMDLAKVVGARVVRPNKSIEKMRGTLKILKKIPLFIAIPSTVGTGSEATLAAVVSNKNTQEKYAIMDPALMPDYAILDIDVVRSLPKKLIAETGMDALTHAVEAYIGKANTNKTKRMAVSAIKIIFNDLDKAYQGDLEALNNMQLAAYQAGVAFTRAYVGNVHAIAHQLSAHYNLAHGYTNAVILPYVLDYYGTSSEVKLAELYDVIQKENSLTIEEKSKEFINQIKKLKVALNIDSSFSGLIQEEDIFDIVNKAYHEANPLYPVPMILDKNDF